MSLAGLFLVVFLVVHLGINLLLILFESHEPFNVAAHFMVTNPLIKVMEIVLFGGIFLHIIYAGILSLSNKLARGGQGYTVTNHSQTSFFSKYMVHTAVIIGIFLVIHLMDFYIKAKFLGQIEEVSYDGGLTHMHDMGALVIAKFKMLPFVVGYIFAFLFLGFHLHHGFQSAFQTIGFNHKVYTPVIKLAGLAYSILITMGYSIIPLYIYFLK